MIRPRIPLKTVGYEVVGCLPDTWRAEVARRRHHVRVLPSADEFDDVFGRAAALFETDDAAARDLLSGFQLAPPPLPADPFSPGYVDKQWELYATVSGRPAYAATNEVEADIEPDRFARSPFPYSTGSHQQVADHLALNSYILRILRPEPSQRVVEFGAGWGNLTIPLAQMGVNVTGVEVSDNLAEVLRRRGDGLDGLEIVQADMLDFHTGGGYDAAVFVSSFHHCADHMKMLEQLRSVVSPDGRVLFVAEPVTSLYYPWGLRLDGLSLWFVRQHGWLELGFDNRYFEQALHRAGWRVVARHRSRSLTPLADIIEVRRA